MSRQQQDAARIRTMLRALDARDPHTLRWADNGIRRLEALANHPAAQQLAVRGPHGPAAWTPAPAAHPASVNRSILRDLVAVIRKALRS